MHKIYVFDIGDYVYSEIHAVRKTNQQELVTEIGETGRKLDFEFDGECDIPGHGSTYCIVTAIDS